MLWLIFATVAGAWIGSTSGHPVAGAAIGAGVVVFVWFLSILDGLLAWWPLWLGLAIAVAAVRSGG